MDEILRWYDLYCKGKLFRVEGGTNIKLVNMPFDPTETWYCESVDLYGPRIDGGEDYRVQMDVVLAYAVYGYWKT